MCAQVLDLDESKLKISKLNLESLEKNNQLPKSILLKIKQCPTPGVTELTPMIDNKSSIIVKI